MTSSQSFKCLELDASTLPNWLHLTSPNLRTYANSAIAESNSNLKKFIALALEGESQERGALLLGEVSDWAINDHVHSQHLYILSVVVAKPFRRKGLGRLLLRYAEHWAKTRQIAELNLPVPLYAKASDALMRLTSPDRGWIGSPGKVVVGLSISSSVETLLQRLEKAVGRQARNASWQMTPFPEHQTAVLQHRITMADDSQLATPWNPEDENCQWQPATQHSRLLWSQGEIIGWLITHFVSPDCLRYAKFWVDPGWEHSGAPLAMLASVMRSAHFSGELDLIPKGCFISDPSNRQLHHWIRKQFKPVSDSWVEIENRNLVLLDD